MSRAARGVAPRRPSAGPSSDAASTLTPGSAGRANGSSRRTRPAFARRGSSRTLDPALLRAFEIDKELYEFVYATTYLPSWLYAPTEGMRALFADPLRDGHRVEQLVADILASPEALEGLFAPTRRRSRCRARLPG